MVEEILIAGFGGQGVMLMGHLLAYGAIYEGLEVTFFPSYGPEMRGGTANCTVVISDQRIGSPIRNTFTAFMAMNQASLVKFEDRVNAGGVLAYNETLIDTPPKRGDVRIIKIPANEIATELGVSPEEGRKALHELFFPGFPGWLYPNTDYITSFAPFNNLPTQYRITIDGQQKWFAQ